MKRITRSIACFLVATSTHAVAQIGINTQPPHESAALDMSDAKRGIIAPRIALTASNDIKTIINPKQGLLVYNTFTGNDIHPGYYFWSINRWEPLSGMDTSFIRNVSTSINASSLGYNPSGSAAASPETFTIGNLVATKKVCASFTDTEKGAQEHSYCGYSLSDNITWEDAFNISQIFKGYITVITSDEEWSFLKSSLLQLEEAQSNIWIGYNQNKEPGNPQEYKWVTGERSKINWSNSSTLQTFYADKEPDVEKKCVKISATSLSANRTWKTEDCENKNNDPFNYLIIEYQNQ